MELFTEEILKMVQKMDLEKLIGMMDLPMKEISKIQTLMRKEFILGTMVEFFQENLSIIKCMGMVFLNGLMGFIMRVIM